LFPQVATTTLLSCTYRLGLLSLDGEELVIVSNAPYSLRIRTLLLTVLIVIFMVGDGWRGGERMG
jgi:hypothetical protein